MHDRIVALAPQATTQQQDGQGRNQGHRQDRRPGHARGLGPGQRAEQPSLHAFEGEDRQERHRDHQQREDDRRPDFLQGRDHQRGAIAPVRGSRDAVMDIVDHDDRGVYHHPDRHRDA